MYTAPHLPVTPRSTPESWKHDMRQLMSRDVLLSGRADPQDFFGNDSNRFVKPWSKLGRWIDGILDIKLSTLPDDKKDLITVQVLYDEAEQRWKDTWYLVHPPRGGVWRLAPEGFWDKVKPGIKKEGRSYFKYEGPFYIQPEELEQNQLDLHLALHRTKGETVKREKETAGGSVKPGGPDVEPYHSIFGG